MLRNLASGLALVALLMACTTGTASPTIGGATPTPLGGVGPTPAGTPALTPGFSLPSFAPDTVLEAAFPDTIDGQPVTDVQTLSFLALLQAVEADQAEIDAFVAAMQGIGVNPATVSFGSGIANVDGENVSIQALRAPGGSAATAIDALIRLDPPEVPPTITAETIGGKPVTVSTLSDGEEEFYYASGEFAWFLSDASREEAEVIFAALP